jgi:hypothetical protein
MSLSDFSTSVTTDSSAVHLNEFRRASSKNSASHIISSIIEPVEQYCILRICYRLWALCYRHNLSSKSVGTIWYDAGLSHSTLINSYTKRKMSVNEEIA